MEQQENLTVEQLPEEEQVHDPGQEGQEGTMPDLSSLKTPEDIAKWIGSSQEEIRYGKELLAITMDLPASARVGSGNLLKALEIILREYFILLPEEVADQISSGKLDVFTFSAHAKERHLRARQVEINTLPGISTLSIRGHEPIDGENGSIELFFNFKTRPGKLLPDGTMDFREVNRFPQASKDQRILRIYEPTTGIEGTDVMGFPIKAKPGRPVKLKLGDDFYFVEGETEETKRRYKDYFSKNAGIIICHFEGAIHPDNLKKISIQNKLKVKSIDFTTGNIKGDNEELRCKADLEVEGDIRGGFAVIIDGALMVKGAVEGETIDATGPIVVGFAKNYVRSGSDIEVGAARKATLTAKGTVTIKKEISDGNVKAKTLVIRPQGVPEVLVGKCHLEANQLEAQGLDIRNIMKIEIGRTHFEQYHILKEQLQELKQERERTRENLKNRGMIFCQKLKLATNLVTDQEDKKLIQVLKKFAAMILMGNVSIDKLRDRMKNLQELIPPELNLLIKHLRIMISLQEEFTKLQKKIDSLKEQIVKQEEELKELSVEMRGNIKESGQIIISCNGIEKKFLARDIKGQRFNLTVRYDLEKGPMFKFQAA